MLAGFSRNRRIIEKKLLEIVYFTFQFLLCSLSDHDNLLAPPDTKSDSYGVPILLSVFQQRPALVPCRATSPKVQMSLYKTSEDKVRLTISGLFCRIIVFPSSGSSCLVDRQGGDRGRGRAWVAYLARDGEGVSCLPDLVPHPLPLWIDDRKIKSITCRRASNARCTNLHMPHYATTLSPPYSP